jgi:hypothetical protein
VIVTGVAGRRGAHRPAVVVELDQLGLRRHVDGQFVAERRVAGQAGDGRNGHCNRTDGGRREDQ